MNDDGDRHSESPTVHLIWENKTPADEASSTMEGHVFPDHEQLLQFLRRLKEVFDVCDEDADGFIRVEHLVDLGLQFGQGDEVRGCYSFPVAKGPENCNIREAFQCFVCI